MPLDEKILIRKLRQGNTKAFEELYFLYHARLFHFCIREIRDTQEAEGVVQEVFIAVWENRDKLDPDRSFSGFVFRIARNKVLNRIKHNLTRQVYLDYMQREVQAHPDPEKVLESREFICFLQETVDSLPEKTRDIFMLSRYEGLTYKEIALSLDISENVVDHEMRRALQQIRERLEKYNSV